MSTTSPWLHAADLLDPPQPPLARYRADPVAFARECFRWPAGQGLTPYQEEVLAAIPEHHRVAVRGPHGLGKTMLSAIVVLWFALTRDGEDWKLPTTASVWRQLEQFLWPEIRKWARLLDWEKLGRKPFDERSELLQLHLKLRTGEAFAVASDDHTKIEGAHADALLYLFDEAKAIPIETFDAAEGAFSGAGSDTSAEAFALAVSTPGEPQGRFYEIHARRPGLEDWWVRHVTLDEAVEAGRISTEWAEQRRRQWGEDSAVFQNRVRGEFATSEADNVIPLAWVEAANDRWRDLAHGAKNLSVPAAGAFRCVGVDVAREGRDATVLAVRLGDSIDTLRYSSRGDTMVTTGLVAGILRLYAAGRAVVDVIGIGSGVVDRLREQGFDVLAFNAGERTDLKDRSGELGFADKRSAAWWGMRERLDPAFDSTVALPPDDMLLGDLTAPRWSVTSTGRIKVESKDDIRPRLGRSTDAGDAVVQAYWDELAQVAFVGRTRPRDNRLRGRR